MEANLIVDLGNSMTRVQTRYATQEDNKVKLSMLSNVFSIVEHEESLQEVLKNEGYNAENSKVFKVNNTIYVNGLMQDSEFNMTSFRPTAQEKKYESLSSKLSLYCAFLQGYQDLSEWTGLDISDLSVDWTVTVLLPAGDVELGGAKIAGIIKTLGRMEFILPNVIKDIVVTGVNVVPEGYSAYMAVLFESRSVMRPEYSVLSDPDNYTLIVDIGAGTTDITIAQGSKVLTNTRTSVDVGGNNVQVELKKELKKQNLGGIRDTWFRKACETGKLKVGSTTIDVSNAVNKAKSNVSVRLVNAIKEFYEANSINIMETGYLLICGGGSVIPEASTGLQPISNYITEYLRNISTNISLVDMPYVVNNGIKEKVSPRLLNIIGAGIIASK